MKLSGREARVLRRRCETIVKGLTIPEPFDLDVLCRTVGERRGRRLRVVPHRRDTDRGSPCGLWVAMQDEDIIFVEQRTSSLHQQHIALHEIGHVLSDHDSSPGLEPDATLRLMPHLDPKMVLRVLGRASYDSPQEREAEMIASLLGERITASRRGNLPLCSEESSAGVVLRNITDAFGGKDR